MDKKILKENLEIHTKEAEADYDWIMPEIYARKVRNYKVGQLARFLEQKELLNEKYIIDRIGYVSREIRKYYLDKGHSNKLLKIKVMGVCNFYIKAIGYLD